MAGEQDHTEKMVPSFTIWAKLAGKLRSMVSEVFGNCGRPASPGTCWATALLIVFLIFPDVVLGPGSLSMIDMSVAAGQPWPGQSSLHFERPDRAAYHGFYDTGGAIYQAEPAQQYMKHVIQTGQSPYWNPYSATGAPGPETLVDNKFSPFSILVAVLGGGSIAYHAALLGIFVCAAYCLLRLVTVHLKLSMLAAVVSTIVLSNPENPAHYRHQTTWCRLPCVAACPC